MSDGERPSQQSSGDGAGATTSNGGGGGGGAGGAASGGGGIVVYDMKGSISESTSSNSSAGSGYLASTSSSSATSSSCSASHSTNKSTLDTSDASTATTTPTPTVIKVTEEEPPKIEDVSGSGSGTDGVVRNEEKSNTMSSESSTDTFHTPSASMQNLAGQSSNSRLSGSSNRKRSDAQGESQQHHQSRQHKERFLEEEEAVHSDSGAGGTPPQPTSLSLAVKEVPEKGSPSPSRSSGGVAFIGGGGEDSLSVNSGSVADDDEPSSSNNTKELAYRKRQHDKKHKASSQQHKRQSSAGSQCSLSSNPENSQFKTADAHSSDSDASRNSGTGGGFAFDNCSGGNDAGQMAAGGSGSDGGMGKDDGQDRRSLQSDHSGEQLNTSVESVEFGMSGEQSPIYVRYDGQALGSPRMSITSELGYVGIGSKPRVKKKMWYQQIFSTSYKTRSADFKKIFKDLPPKERLIVDYSCALQKEILLQGRMYVSQNFVSFYSNIFGWETQLSISFTEIESITKEKTALIIPNAIQIHTMNEKFFFSSFVTRDTTYVMLFKLWQSALLEETMSKRVLWELVHTCYGEELGVTSEDESEEMFCQPLVPTSSVTTTIMTSSAADGVTKSISIEREPNDDEKGRSSSLSSFGRGTPEITIDKCKDVDVGEGGDDFDVGLLGDDDAQSHRYHHELDVEDDVGDDGDDEGPRIGSLGWCRLRTGSVFSGLISTGEIGGAIAVGLNIGSSIVTSNGIPISSEQLLSKDGNILSLPVPGLPMTEEPSDSSDAEGLIESDLRKEIPTSIPIVTTEAIDHISERVIPCCPVDHTNGKEMMNAVIPCNIDQLFTMLFTNSSFYLDFQLKRKTSDINQSDWQIGDGSQKSRQLTFTVVTGQTIGPKTAQVTETQNLLPASQPGLLYAIQSESVNAGIPYADAFSVNCHYCLTKLSDMEANMVVISKIHYKKSTWAKSFIERNSMNAMTDFFSSLEKALKEECAKMNAGGITPTSPIVVSSLPRRRHPRKKGRAPDIPGGTAMSRSAVESNKIHPGTLERGGTLPKMMAGHETMSDTVTDGVEGSLVMKVILAVLGCLLLLNGFLYFKLSSLETAANMSVLYPPTIQLSGEAPQNHQEWLMLLQQQETLHRSEVHGWHEVLVSAIKILHQAEKDLESLKGHISAYGKGDVAIVEIPTASVVNGLGTSPPSSPSISSSSNVIPEKSSDSQQVDKNNNQASSDSDASSAINIEEIDAKK